MKGLIGRKIGMTQVFDDKGILTPVSVIKVDDNFVVGKRLPERDGYSACLLGSIEKKENLVSKPYAGQFSDGVKPQKYLYEIRDFDGDYEVGQKFGVELFTDAWYVDVEGTSKGKGFQGVIKRHGFSGGSSLDKKSVWVCVGPWLIYFVELCASTISFITSSSGGLSVRHLGSMARSSCQVKSTTSYFSGMICSLCSP